MYQTFVFPISFLFYFPCTHTFKKASDICSETIYFTDTVHNGYILSHLPRYIACRPNTTSQALLTNFITKAEKYPQPLLKIISLL